MKTRFWKRLYYGTMIRHQIDKIPRGHAEMIRHNKTLGTIAVKTRRNGKSIFLDIRSEIRGYETQNLSVSIYGHQLFEVRDQLSERDGPEFPPELARTALGLLKSFNEAPIK